jgi:antitoxin component of MazEF toxin-antitoxin module
MEDPMMELRLRRVGNSFGVILPKEALEALGIAGKEKKLALLRDTLKRYKNTLRALAK